MVWRPILLLLWSMNRTMKNYWIMENIDEKVCSCALNRIFGFHPKIGLALISCIGSAAEIFRMKSDEVDHLLGAYSKYKGVVTPAAADEAADELESLEKMDIRFVGWNEDDYPALLRECEDAPIGLYVRSTTPLNELWKPQRKIAVVGTRDISPYGREWCMKTVSGLASSAEKPVIVSGLALGTDYYAHKTALEHGLPTIGVMATGPETVYPQRHRQFAEKLYHTPGCALVTDYPPGTPPLGVHFLRRNRIIAGLSDSTILIESKIKGGGMMTSNLAFSYSREVYALPGRADDIRSQGCNYLIKNKIAEPIFSTDELLKSMNLNGSGKTGSRSVDEILEHTYGQTMPAEQLCMMRDILNLIRKERGLTADDISEATGLPYHKVSNIVNILETDELITVDLLQRCVCTFK